MDVPNTFVAGTTIKSGDMNANFASLFPSVTGTAADTLGDYLDNSSIFNVKNVGGAIGDGVADDTTAIQATIAAAAPTGGIVYLPIGTYLVSSQLVLTGGVTLRGGGSGYSSFNTCLILWTGTGFCIKMGNTTGALSYGMEVSNLRISLLTSNSAIWMYGAAHAAVRNVDIEGVQFTTTSIGVQIDGANISSFFVTLDAIQCNHVFKGFVHTTTGTQPPTQVLGLNCSALCDQTTGSIGIDIQHVGSTGCGDGVCYVGGNMEACDTGVNLNGGGTSIIGMRFENTQGVASDVTFGTSALDNKLIGCSGLYGLTDNANKFSNQVIACSLDTSTNASQMNRLDALTLGEDLALTPNGSTPRNIVVSATNTYTGKVFVQAGGGSAAYGGALNLYGHSHATHPGDVVAGISSGSGGKFRVNSQGQDAGTDWFVVDGAGAGVTTILGFSAATVKAAGGFGCNSATPQTPVSGGAALAAYGSGANGFATAGNAQEIHDKLNIVLTALRANGILTT